MRKAICKTCKESIFRAIGKPYWAHTRTKLFGCAVQRAQGYSPRAEPQKLDYWNGGLYAHPTQAVVKRTA